jgi:hypothetical protein
MPDVYLVRSNRDVIDFGPLRGSGKSGQGAGLSIAFADDLGEQASYLAQREKRKPKQASLRRAVSASYYAVFHLLISDAVANWKTIRQRASLARAFEHGKMRSACERALRAPFVGLNPNSVANLKMVAEAFIQLQQQRHTADYDNSKNVVTNRSPWPSQPGDCRILGRGRPFLVNRP